MDFGIYPPEINSGRMYAGPGSGPLLAAAQAWEALADELYTAAGSYQSVVSELTSESWSGPSSASMAAAAGSYVPWLSATAAQAGETAAQARAAVAAYEAAFALTVPPPVIAANRSLLTALVATNFFGQNTPAIAATEAEYAGMWAQDAAAMYGYAGSSASASALTPFSSPQQNTDPGGAAGQAAAVGQATATSAGNVQSILTGVSPALSAAATPAQSTPLDFLNNLANLITVFASGPASLVITYVGVPLNTLGGPVDFPIAYIGTVSGLHTDDDASAWFGVQPWPGTEEEPPGEFPAIITNPGPLAATAPTMSAGLGEAHTVGALSVPSAWTVAAPEVRPVALELTSASSSPTAAVPLEVGSGSALREMGLAGMAGRAMTGPPGTGSGQYGGESGTGTRVPSRPARAAADGESKASPSKPRIVVTGVASRIRELARLRDEGMLTHEEFTEQKDRLLGR